ncbi:MAG: two-component system sensor histidine kinase NtrB [Phycisphaerae bacterium]
MSGQKRDNASRPTSEFLRLAFSNAPVALIATDEYLRLLFCSRPAADLLNVDPEQLVGRTLEESVPVGHREDLGRKARQVLENHRTARTELELPGEDGQRHLAVVLSAVGDSPGSVHGLCAWLSDSTSERRLAHRLAQSEKMAALGTLAGGVAHHFNNILGGVATFVDYALRSGDDSAMRRALEMTAEAADRASRITQSLLSFAEQGTPRRRDLVDLTEVVLTFVHLVERPLSQQDIQLKLDLQPIPTVPVEAQRMHQVLNNLLSNAEEAMPDGGTITIGIAREGDNAVLTFADTGVGIPREKLSQIFDPFFTTKGLVAGGETTNPGLGLSVVHGLILEMGADIRAQSTPGKGTTFTIAIPITEP